MGPIPPLDPRLCMKAYQAVKKHFIDPSSASTSAGTNTPDPHCQDENSMDMQEDCSKTSEDSILTANSKTDDECRTSETEQTKAKKKRRGIMLSKNPRKSPRQHASTLAILSSLIHQRKRRNDANRSRSSELNSSKQSLPSIPEVNEDKDVPSKEELDYDRIAQSMDNVFSSMKDLDQLEISPEENVIIDMNRKMSAIDILEDYDKKQKDNAGNPIKRVYASGKKPGRKKKKKNRTGWPNKKDRRTKKGNETLKEEEPDDNSTVDSLSVNADSDFVEDNCDDGNEEVNSEVANRGGNRINNSIDQSNNSVQLNVNNTGNVQTSRVTTTENNLKHDRVNTVYVNDNCTDKVYGKESNDRIVDLDRWENAEKVLSAKVTNNEINSDIQFQPYVRVQKLDSGGVSAKRSNRQRLRNSSSPHRTVKRPRRMPASPKSPRMLRKPRGRWYRER
ncbi:hypothetical protein MML48_5g00013444 [Holotrichia oblita]|uniref:Uncharacterized protein n=1 Tax=Holotrichia oblita TaxID=644536 RepID=A0ACB9T2I3_HOLOL|nr:hypothetical protein MML48_5g00013444 [Holotrichia oblita]